MKNDAANQSKITKQNQPDTYAPENQRFRYYKKAYHCVKIKKSGYITVMEKDFNTVKEKNTAISGINFWYEYEPINEGILKGRFNLSIRDEKGNSRSMIWNPDKQTIEQVIEGILESKRWP